MYLCSHAGLRLADRSLKLSPGMRPLGFSIGAPLTRLFGLFDVSNRVVGHIDKTLRLAGLMK